MSVTMQLSCRYGSHDYIGLCYAVACFHSDSVSGSSVRIECHIEGTTSPGNTENVMERINEIVTGKDFYIPGTIVSSGNSC